jgi:hypothetical protein
MRSPDRSSVIYTPGSPNPVRYRCTAKTKSGTWCTNCVVNLKENQILKVGCRWYIVCGRHTQNFAPFEVAQGKRTREDAINRPRLVIDPDTCFAHIQEDDAYFHMTTCDTQAQQRCLKKKQLARPAVTKLLIAEKYEVQSLATKKIATHFAYVPLAVDVLNQVQETLQRFFPDVLFLLKGSAAIRLMLQGSMNDPNLLSAKLKNVFQDYVQHSDLDTMILLDPSGLNRTEYQFKVQAIMESIFGRLLRFIRTLDTSTRESIRSLVSEIPTTNDSKTLQIQPTLRKSFQLHPDPEDPSVFIREFFDASSSISLLNGSYLVHCRPGLQLQTDDQIFFEPDHIPHSVRRTSRNTLEFETLTPFKEKEVAIQISRDQTSDYIQVKGYLTERKDHLENMQLEIRDDYFDEVQGQIQSSSTLLINGGRMKFQNLVQQNRVVLIELEAKIFPRVIGGLRKRANVIRKSTIYTSYQSSIQIPEVGADFALLRVLFPISFRKGRRVGLTKAELVDISLANYDDAHRVSQWRKFFRPGSRQSWLSFICSCGLQGRSICMSSVNLRYQELDLARMKLEKQTGSKSKKREMRSRLIDELYRYLGFVGPVPKLKPKLGNGWTNPPRVKLNAASVSLLNEVLNGDDFPLGDFTDEDWTTLKTAIDHHQSTSGGILNILDHLITVYNIKKNPGYNRPQDHPLDNRGVTRDIPIKLLWLRELYEYFGRGITFKHSRV